MVPQFNSRLVFMNPGLTLSNKKMIQAISIPTFKEGHVAVAGEGAVHFKANQHSRDVWLPSHRSKFPKVRLQLMIPCQTCQALVVKIVTPMHGWLKHGYVSLLGSIGIHIHLVQIGIGVVALAFHPLLYQYSNIFNMGPSLISTKCPHLSIAIPFFPAFFAWSDFIPTTFSGDFLRPMRLSTKRLLRRRPSPVPGPRFWGSRYPPAPGSDAKAWSDDGWLLRKSPKK